MRFVTFAGKGVISMFLRARATSKKSPRKIVGTSGYTLKTIHTFTFTFTFICHPGTTRNHRSRGDTPWKAQTHPHIYFVGHPEYKIVIWSVRF